MFLEKYLDNFYLDLVYDTYDYKYLNTIDENNFVIVYNVFLKYNFYFINDIILKYLEIFELDSNIVEEGIIRLREKLGNDFVYIIGHDMRYLEDIKKN